MNRKATGYLFDMIFNADTGSSIESILDVHLHKADFSFSFSTFLLLFPLHLSLPCFCPLLFTSLTSASFYIRYLKALPLSVLSALLSRLSTHTRCFAFIRPSAPLHCTFQLFPSTPLLTLTTYCLSTLCASPRNSNTSPMLEYLFLT